jgi:hypothetical protein
MPHGDAREGKWRGNWRMEWVASTLHTISEHGVSSITTADAHTSAASSRLNWHPRRFKWTRPFRGKTKSGFCACAITFQTQSTSLAMLLATDRMCFNNGQELISRMWTQKFSCRLRWGVVIAMAPWACTGGQEWWPPTLDMKWTRSSGCQTLCIHCGEEWRLPEHCACSRYRSGGYQGTENVPGRGLVAVRHCGEEWRLPEHCACSRYSCGGY